MQAIEFNSVVKAHHIPLSEPISLASDLPVRVVVYEEPASLVTKNGQMDAILALCANPLVVSNFVPLARDEAYER